MKFCFILSLMTANFAFSATTISLKSVDYQKVVHEINLTFTDSKACRLAGKMKIEPQPTSRQCQEWSTLSNDAIKEMKSPSRGETPLQQSTVDEPIYQFSYQNKTLWLDLKAPEECDLERDGTLNCKPNQLTAAEKLLLELRPYFR